MLSSSSSEVVSGEMLYCLFLIHYIKRSLNDLFLSIF